MKAENLIELYSARQSSIYRTRGIYNARPRACKWSAVVS